MNDSKIAIGFAVITAVVQGGLYLASGGFSAGKQLTGIESDVKQLRAEIIAANQVQDFRLNAIEARIMHSPAKLSK